MSTLEPIRISAMPDANTRETGLGSKQEYGAVLRNAMGLVRNELARVEVLLTDEVVTRSGIDALAMQEMLDYVKCLGGKRLRPSLTLLAAKACGGATEESIRLAASIELVHTATLVHDDILDNANERRHRPTVHTQWGNHSSVLVGDWLFTHAYELANMGTSTLPGRWIAQAAKRVCEGEIMQGQSVGRFDLAEEEYFDILGAKTGALCEVSCRIGAWSAGADTATVEAFAQFGYKLGVAFQVFDDWLDVWGDATVAGKTLGTDLHGRKPTLPTIYALRQSGGSEFAKCRKDGNGFCEASLRKLLDRCDASNYTRFSADRWGGEAIQQLTPLLANKGFHNDSIQALQSLAYCATHRTV